jgi:hypothetical protein
MNLGLGNVSFEYENLFSDILDMFLTGQKGRPSSTGFEHKLRVILKRFEDDEE